MSNSYRSPTIAASGTTFAQAQASGASGHLEKLIAAMPAGTLAPTVAPTLAASGSGNTLPAGNYYVVVTESNGYGETTASPVSSVQAITLGQLLTVTPHSLQSGNSYWSAYVGTAAAGPFFLALAGQSGSNATISAPLPADALAQPPAANSTGLSKAVAGTVVGAKLNALRAIEKGRVDAIWRDFARMYGEFNRGEPVQFSDVLEAISILDILGSTLHTLAAEWGALVVANPGHSYVKTTGIGGAQTRRSWP